MMEHPIDEAKRDRIERDKARELKRAKRERYLTRGDCLALACEVYRGTGAAVGPDTITGLAEHFERWLLKPDGEEEDDMESKTAGLACPLEVLALDGSGSPVPCKLGKGHDPPCYPWPSEENECPRMVNRGEGRSSVPCCYKEGHLPPCEEAPF